MLFRKLAVCSIVLTLLTAACSDEPAEADPEAIIALAIETMGNVDTVGFFLERTGAPIYIDEDSILEFTSAEGRFSTPESTDALLTVRALGIPTQVGAVQIGEDTWITNPITGGWEDAPSGFTFDVATLFDRTQGWSALLDGGLTNVHFTGEEKLGDETLAHYRVTAPADRIEQITAGMVAGQAVDGDLWIDSSTGEIRELTFNTDMADGVTTWSLRMTDYGAEVEISPPDLNG